MAKGTDVAVKQPKQGESLVRGSQTQEQYLTPATDIYETPDAFVVMMDIPGVQKKDISISIDTDNLVIKAITRPLHEENTVLSYNEISNLNYYRAFALGQGVDRNNVDARYEDGVLTMKLFKNEQVKTKEIRIQ